MEDLENEEVNDFGCRSDADWFPCVWADCITIGSHKGYRWR
jgi:hypothetical protein